MMVIFLELINNVNVTKSAVVDQHVVLICGALIVRKARVIYAFGTRV